VTSRPSSGRRQRQQPAYAVLRDQLRKDIHKGRYRPGQWLPTEAELVSTTGLSRHTVRAALDGLREDGLVSRHPGRGTVVSSGAGDSSSVRVISTDKNIFGIDLDSVIRILQPLTLVEDPEVAELLSVPDAELTNLRFCREVAEARIGAWHIWTPGYFYDDLVDEVPLLNGTAGSLLQLLERTTGRLAVRADQTVTAEEADDAMAEVLGINPGKALIRMERTYFDRQGSPLEHLVVRYVPEHFAYRLQLLRKVEPGTALDATSPNSKDTAARTGGDQAARK
jgi:GntR family transcriptional regulator